LIAAVECSHSLQRMDLDKKPGARDGKPKKGTRRGGRRSGPAKPQEKLTLKVDPFDTAPPGQYGSKGDKADEETGLLPGVEYSVNKGKRWELVDKLREQSEQDREASRNPQSAGSSSEDSEGEEEKEKRGQVMLVEAVDNRQVRRQLREQIGPVAADARKHQAKQEKATEDGDKVEQPEMIKSRKGPKPKKNLPKKKGGEDDGVAPYEPERVFVVVHEPSAKGDALVVTVSC
jgi:hypothetical protein